MRGQIAFYFLTVCNVDSVKTGRVGFWCHILDSLILEGLQSLSLVEFEQSRHDMTDI